MPVLEEIVAATPLNRAASLAFGLSRCVPGKPVMVIGTAAQSREAGRPSVHGINGLLGAAALLMVIPKSAVDALWTMEQALKSGGLGCVFGLIDELTLVQSRRLDFAARDGGTPALLLASKPGGLSAARRRWRIAALPSAQNPFDARAPGVPRLHAELVRQRDGLPGAWTLSHDAESGFTVAEGLAFDRAPAIDRRAA